MATREFEKEEAMSLVCDLFITTKGGHRHELLRRSMESLFECTDRSLFRLTVIEDGWEYVTHKVIDDLDHDFGIDHVLIHGKTLGLGPSINQALAHIDALNRYYEHPTHGDRSQVAPFIAYCQDDILYTKGWLQTMVSMFTLLEGAHKLGFASGIECIEHPVREVISDTARKMQIKDWIRAASMFGRRSYWMSMYPIPRLDPETGRVRANPHLGIGSGVDWHFVRNHENSICRTGRTCLVIPGLLQHAGYKESTWLQRELPESEEDKRTIDGNSPR